MHERKEKCIVSQKNYTSNFKRLLIQIERLKFPERNHILFLLFFPLFYLNQFFSDRCLPLWVILCFMLFSSLPWYKVFIRLCIY